MLLEWLVPAIIVVLGLWIVFTHQRLKGKRQAAIATWDPLEAVLRQRHDLVAPLIQAALAHAPKQKNLTDALLQARNAALRAGLSPDATGQAEIQLEAAIQRVLNLARTLPELNADLTFRRIQRRCEQLEEEITAAGDAFNEAALAYNRAALTVPTILVAKYANLDLLQYFAIQGEDREAMRLAALEREP